MATLRHLLVDPVRASAQGKGNRLTERGMRRDSVWGMVKRRAATATLPYAINPHSFRAAGITEYIRNGGDVETAAHIAGHESTRTTQLYNRVQEDVSLDEIERIRV